MSSNLTPSAIVLAATDAAWLAGYIDGDGCICLTKTGRRFRSAILIIDSADRELIEHVQNIVGGGHFVVKKKVAAHHRQGWSWRLNGMHNVSSILRQIYPYLRCDFKRERARLILEEWIGVTPRNGFYTPEAIKQKEAFEARFMAIGAGRGKRARENLVMGL